MNYRGDFSAGSSRFVIARHFVAIAIFCSAEKLLYPCVFLWVVVGRKAKGAAVVGISEVSFFHALKVVDERNLLHGEGVHNAENLQRIRQTNGGQPGDACLGQVPENKE